MRFILFLSVVLAAGVAAGMEFSPVNIEESWLYNNRARILQLFGARGENPRLNDYGSVDTAAVQLGHKLFFDKRLSGSEKISCATCHQPNRFWTDGRQVAEGAGVSKFNTPTLAGVRRLKWLFWDGRAIGLAHQALEPMYNHEEMAGDVARIIQIFGATEEYRLGYEKKFGSLPSAKCVNSTTRNCKALLNVFELNVAGLLATFVASIESPETEFDRFLAELARNEKQKTFQAQHIRGIRIFIEKGNCAACHSGGDFTDGQFHNVLVPESAGPSVFSAGRYGAIRDAISRRSANRDANSEFDSFVSNEFSRARSDSSMFGAFKTPTLRGLRCTSPYMHNGKYENLEEVVKHYSSFENVIRPQHHDDPLLQPRSFSKSEQEDLIAFLLTLSAKSETCR